jgi:hypothetical protein
MDKQPKLGYVINPKTNREIKIGGPIYRKLVADKIIKPVDVKLADIVLNPKPPKKIKDGYVINPKSGYPIKKAGDLYNRLLKQGVIFYDNDLPILKVNDDNPNSKSHLFEIIMGKQYKKCHKEQIRNPETKRCVNKNGKLGIKILNDLKKDKEKSSKSSYIDIDRSKCINKDTFLLLSSIDDIPKEDFLMLPSGYCFDVSELINYIKSSGFFNKNPHVSSETLFTDENKYIWDKYPELSDTLSKYFKKKKGERNTEIELLKDNLDLLYKIGDVGRICYYNNIYSHDNTDSSIFEYAISSIFELSEMINKLSPKDKEIFKNLRSTNGQLTIEKIIDDANKGASCIHGVGMYLISIFVTNFLILEKYMISKDFKDFKYEPLRCKLYFVVDKNNNIVIYNAENRAIVNTDKQNIYYYRQHFEPFLKNIKGNTSMIWSMTKLKTDGLSSVFIQKCINDPDLASIDSIDNWSELDEWRKIMLEDGYCFDLLYLIKVITIQLNTTKMTNPTPHYPTNIFTSNIISMKDLINIKRRIIDNYIIVSPVLLKFLSNANLFWSEDESYVKSHQWMSNIITIFERELRFKRYLDKIDINDQGQREYVINGYWVLKNEIVSENENNVLRYLHSLDISYINRMPLYIIPDVYYYSLNKYINTLIDGYL